jgi:hypothetical protein
MVKDRIKEIRVSMRGQGKNLAGLQKWNSKKKA